MSEQTSPAVMDSPSVTKWESEDEFEARLKRIESHVPQAGKSTPSEKVNLSDKETAVLVAENEKLKQMAEEARRRVSQVEDEVRKLTKREAEYEKMLEEKSEEIREVQQQLTALQSKQTIGITEEELLALHDELKQERETLEEDRQSMEEQFRQLELNMSRERAEIARERNEMQRTKSELKHKLEQLEKNASQGDFSPLRRLREEMSTPAQSPAAGPPRSTLPTLPAPVNLPAINRRAPEGSSPKRSGLLSRFLGNKDQ